MLGTMRRRLPKAPVVTLGAVARPDERIVIACCLLIGAATVLLAPALGYDAWAWMVWARELTELSLDTTGGPSWKPLPVLVSAPFAWIDGLAPFLWLALVRGAALYAIWLAGRCAARLAGTPAAAAAFAVAAFGLLVSTDLPRTALYGSSEPLLVAFVLGAVLLHLRDRQLMALSLLALAGLIRPELWLLTLIYGLWCAHRLGRRHGLIAALVVVPPLIWVIFDWAGSGGLAQGAATAQGQTPTSAARAAIPALEVFSRLGDSVIAPVLLLALAALVFAWRQRNREVLLLALLVIGWVAVVAVMAQLGFTGARRYLAGPAALSCVLAGVRAGWLIAAAPARTVKYAATAAIALLFLGFGIFVLRTDARLLSVARLDAEQSDQLSGAISATGGRDAIVAVGRPAINPYEQTGLAWKLDLPLRDVQGTWASTESKPNWQPPAIVFVAPARVAGPKPAFGPEQKLKKLINYGRWEVFRAYR
jgi:hypothetical protein